MKKIPSEMEEAPHYKLLVHFFKTFTLARLRNPLEPGCKEMERQ